MEKSLSIPHFGYTAELDITELHALLPLLNASIPAQYLPPSVRAQREPPAIRHGMVNPLAPFPKEQQGGVHEAAVVEDVDEAGQYTKLTYLPVLLKTLSKAMMEWPLLRSSISAPLDGGNKPTLSVRATADISLALSTPTGLYTPTLVAANTYSVYDLASRVKRLSELGRQVSFYFFLAFAFSGSRFVLDSLI
jgi:2-oxoisovalerate dehydrogenase E2 component (dihydrolipoyl transacylase)